jgi:hypothetical protein
MSGECGKAEIRMRNEAVYVEPFCPSRSEREELGPPGNSKVSLLDIDMPKLSLDAISL